MGKRNISVKGFTLVELMLVVTIIGVLAAIAVPKFSNLLRKSQEGATKGSLGALRSALMIYFADMEGAWPGDPYSFTVGGKYLSSIPTARAPFYHADNSIIGLVATGPGTFDWAWNLGGSPAGWVYNVPAGPTSNGNIFVNCTHTDAGGGVWSAY